MAGQEKSLANEIHSKIRKVEAGKIDLEMAGLPSLSKDKTNPLVHTEDFPSDASESSAAAGSRPRQIAEVMTGLGRTPVMTNISTPSFDSYNRPLLNLVIEAYALNIGVYIDVIHRDNLWSICVQKGRLLSEDEIQLYLNAVHLSNQISATDKLKETVSSLSTAVERLNNQSAADRDNSRQMMERLEILSGKVDSILNSVGSVVSAECSEIKRSVTAMATSLGTAITEAMKSVTSRLPIHPVSATAPAMPHQQKGPTKQAILEMFLSRRVSPKRAEELAEKYWQHITHDEYSRARQAGKLEKFMEFLVIWKGRLEGNK